jgi:hypothetical protein
VAQEVQTLIANKPVETKAPARKTASKAPESAAA